MKISKELRKELNDYIEKSHVARVRFLNHALAKRLNEGDDLPISHSATLLTLFLSEEPLEPAQISDIIHVPRQTLTSVLDALERASFLFRADHSSDRRRKILILTEKGTEKAYKIFKRVKSYEEKVISILSDEERAFLDRIHEKLCNHMIELDNGEI